MTNVSVGDKAGYIQIILHSQETTSELFLKWVLFNPICKLNLFVFKEQKICTYLTQINLVEIGMQFCHCNMTL